MADVGYGGGVPQVAPDTRVPDDYQHIAPSPSEFGSLIGQGLEKAGAGVTDTSSNLFNIAQFQGKVNVDYEGNNYIDARNRILYGDPTKPRLGPDGMPVIGPDGKPMPDTGYMGLQGADAPKAREATLDQLRQLRDAGRKNLTSPQAQLEYDNQTRRIYSEAEQHIGIHAETQWKNWAATVNDDGAKHSLNEYVRNLGNPKAMDNHEADYVHFKVQAAQVRFGNDPTIIQHAVEDARRDVLKARVDAIGVNDPVAALRVLEKNKDVAGIQYDDMYNHLRTRKEQQNGANAGITSLNSARAETAQFFKARTGANVEGLNPQFAEGLRRATMDYEAETGGKARFDSMVRSSREQAILRWEYEHGVGGLAAPPGHSRHEIGEGADIPDGPFQNWLHKNAANYGLAFLPGAAFSKDPGHVQLAVSQGQPAGYGGGVQSVVYAPGVQPVGIPNQGARVFVKADAYKNLMDMRERGEINDNEFQHGATMIDRTVRAEDIAYNENEKKKKDTNDEAANGYVTRMLSGDVKGLLDEIAVDPRLGWQTKDHLSQMVEKASGSDVEKSARTYGPGYWGAYRAIVATEDDPARISDPVELYRRAGPGGDLTVSGVEKLTHVMSEIRKSPDAASVNRTKVSMLDYARNEMAREQIIPGIGKVSVNLKGQKIFDSMFVPAFEASYDAWVKAGKSPWEFFKKKKENIDDLMDQIYPRSQRAHDLISAQGEDEKPPAANTPLPAAPKGANAEAWSRLVAEPPRKDDGGYVRNDLWGKTLEMLYSDPEKGIPLFDASAFGEAGYSGAAISALLRRQGPLVPPPAEPVAPPSSPGVVSRVLGRAWDEGSSFADIFNLRRRLREKAQIRDAAETLRQGDNK